MRKCVWMGWEGGGGEAACGAKAAALMPRTVSRAADALLLCQARRRCHHHTWPGRVDLPIYLRPLAAAIITWGSTTVRRSGFSALRAPRITAALVPVAPEVMMWFSCAGKGWAKRKGTRERTGEERRGGGVGKERGGEGRGGGGGGGEGRGGAGRGGDTHSCQARPSHPAAALHCDMHICSPPLMLSATLTSALHWQMELSPYC